MDSDPRLVNSSQLPADVKLTPYPRLQMTIHLVLLDTVLLIFCGGFTIGIWSWINPVLVPSSYFRLIPVVFFFPLLYAATGLYPAMGISPVEEMRRLALATTAVFLSLATISFWVRNVELYSRAAFGITWILSLVVLPTGREVYRQVLSRFSSWGEAAAVIGNGDRTRVIIEMLLKNRRCGLVPVILVGDQVRPAWLPPEIGFLSQDEFHGPTSVFLQRKIRTAIVVSQEINPAISRLVLYEQKHPFSHLILFPELDEVGTLWVTPLDFNGTLGFEVRQNLLSHTQQYLKRGMDLLLILIFSPVLLPLMILISIFVHFDSPGGVFFRHRRIGYGGVEIKIIKYRTMTRDADQVLEKYLKQDSAARAEWDSTRKLRRDPRITRMGRMLRKFSLDELPQIWNVIKGDMSIVGPRPIVSAEAQYYQNDFSLYKRVKPGITGLWQVSGRNDLSYPERVRLDAYYVRNWSPWLDLYILARTVLVVMGGRGAY